MSPSDRGMLSTDIHAQTSYYSFVYSHSVTFYLLPSVFYIQPSKVLGFGPPAITKTYSPLPPGVECERDAGNERDDTVAECLFFYKTSYPPKFLILPGVICNFGNASASVYSTNDNSRYPRELLAVVRVSATTGDDDTMEAVCGH